MSRIEIITDKLQHLPENLQEEALHYVEFLESKSDGVPFNGFLMSWGVLAEDWLSPEDEEAWKDL